ncbi:MAG: response regulator, partial [Polyangiaceae bacterium]
SDGTRGGLRERTQEVAAVVDRTMRPAEPCCGLRVDLERDPEALAAALDALRVQHEELVVSERARTDAIFTYAPDAYLITDRAGLVRDANLAALSFFDRELAALVDKPLATLISGQDGPALFEMITNAETASAKKNEQRLRIRFRDEDHAPLATGAVAGHIATNDTLFWRFRVLADEPAKGSRSLAPRSNAVPSSLRILVIAHDDETRSVVTLAASSFDGETRTTDSMTGALEILRSFDADIVVADLFVQGHAGTDIITELRARNHRPIPLGIALSGVASADSRHALAAGFHSFLMKPVTAHSVRNALQATVRVLEKRRKRARKRA